MTEHSEASDRAPYILIVEDSRVQAELLRHTVAGAGYGVGVAHDGAEGLKMAKARRPDLIISDINMPVMNGYGLCRAIKYDDALWNVPLILVTVLSEPEDIIEAINAGADAYIIKPYAETMLLERVRCLLDAPILQRRSDERREEVVGYDGERHHIAGGGQQMVNLLLSLYENTLNQNRELTLFQTQLNLLNASLDRQVQERTAALTRLNRMLRTLSAGNQALMRARDETGLLQSIVAVLVEQGGYARAEISYVEDDKRQTVKRMAWACDPESGDPENGDASAAQTPITAIDSGAIKIVRNIPVAADAPDVAPHRYAAHLCAPLADGGNIFGALCIYSYDPNSFDDEEVKLAEELADNIAYGIVSLRARTGLQVSEQSLRDSEQMFGIVTTTAQDAIIMMDDQGLTRFWNPAAEKLFGYSAAEIVAHGLHERVMPERYWATYQAGMAHFRKTGAGAAIGRTTELIATDTKCRWKFPLPPFQSASIGTRWASCAISANASRRNTRYAHRSCVTGGCSKAPRMAF